MRQKIKYILINFREVEFIKLTKNAKILCFCGMMLVFVALAVIFGIFDLDISNAIANDESSFGLAMELSGMLVAPYLFIAAGFTITAYCQKSVDDKKKKLKVFLGYAFAVGGIIFCATIYLEFSKLASLFAFLLTGIACGILIALLRRKTQAQLCELFEISVITIGYLLAVLIVINLIKIPWGRVRFRDMTDPAQFSPWYAIQGINGHRSFPSGHTSNAATLYVVTLFVPFCKKYWQKALCYAIPILWIIIMAASRVLVGAHYASDVLFGGLISVGLFYITRRIVFKKMGKIGINSEKI